MNIQRIKIYCEICKRKEIYEYAFSWEFEELKNEFYNCCRCHGTKSLKSLLEERK